MINNGRMDVITGTPQPSPLHADTGTPRRSVRVALVQTRWLEDPDAHQRRLADGIARAAADGAAAVFLQELTLSRYPGDTPRPGSRRTAPSPSSTAPRSRSPGSRQRSTDCSCTRRCTSVPPRTTGRRTRAATTPRSLVAPDGTLVGRTRKTHIPISAGYYEDTWFRPGADDDPFPVHDAAGLRLGLPTCWDEWFPEVARSYGLGGSEVLAYPTAIGSEPTFPAFDTAPIWRQVIVANGITAGQFMVVPNRWGDEGDITFYGSSFISDPFGRVLVEAPRDADAVLVADLDLDARVEWLRLFPST